MPPLDLLATSAFGLEAVVSRELKRLGYDSRNIQPGRTLFTGTAEAIARSNLWLRTADRVLLRMGAFEARDFGVLFDATYALPWHEWIPADACFPVTGRSHKSQLSSVPACQKIVKKAIVEKLRAAHGVTELPETGPRFKVDVALLSDEATLTIDTSGAGLNKRGYRTLSGPAPLKETLAAALVLLSHWRPEQPLVDPFCGTGTIPIEAAMIGRNLAPGRLRTFDAEAWPALAASHWSEARDEASAAALPALPQRVLGTDRDEEVLSLARYHAQQAGVADDVHFQVKEFSDLTSKRQYGVVIANPPYGQRLGEQEEAAAVSRLMPQVLRRLPTWSHFILTATPDFESLVGQQATKRRKLYNARIECTYYQFYGPRAPRPGRSREAEPLVEAGAESVLPSEEGQVSEPEETVGEHFGEDGNEGVLPEVSQDLLAAHTHPGPVPEGEEEVQTARKAPAAARIVSKPAFGGLPDRAANQAELFRNRLVKLARHLRRWPTRQGITCYRLYERDIPEVPLVVDRYENHLHIAEFARPNEHTLAEHSEWIDLMLKTAADALEVPRQNVYFKHRDRQRGNQQYQRQDESGQTVIVQEGGLKFQVNLSDYVDTGLFLDHRITRGMVREAAAGKRFLNLFCYTGAFTVYAAAGGAATTTSVDLSNTYLDWAAANLRLNGLARAENRLVRADVLEFLRTQPVEPTFDLAVADVPTYSNSKMTEEDFDVQQHYVEMLSLLLGLMTPGGVVYFSTNFRRFHFDETQFPAATVREISRQTVPADFRNKRIHRCWRLIK